LRRFLASLKFSQILIELIGYGKNSTRLAFDCLKRLRLDSQQLLQITARQVHTLTAAEIKFAVIQRPSEPGVFCRQRFSMLRIDFTGTPAVEKLDELKNL
jgi:hypothetical protein